MWNIEMKVFLIQIQRKSQNAQWVQRKEVGCKKRAGYGCVCQGALINSEISASASKDTEVAFTSSGKRNKQP